jgi:hypothetical protein
LVILAEAGKETDFGDNSLNAGESLGDLAQEITRTNTIHIDINIAKRERSI